MLKLFTQLFGKDFWKHVIIVFTWCDPGCEGMWGESRQAIIKSDPSFTRLIEQQFELDFSLPIVFVSSRGGDFSALYAEIKKRPRFTCSLFQRVQDMKDKGEDPIPYLIRLIMDTLSVLINESTAKVVATIDAWLVAAKEWINKHLNF